MSFTRSSRHSSSRSPGPYSSVPIIHFTPCRFDSTLATSLRLSTTGSAAASSRGRRVRPDPRAGAPFVEKQQRRERLVLCRSADMTIGGEPRQEGRDVLGLQRRGVRLAVEQDVPADPRHVGRFRPPTVVPHAGGVAHLVQQLRRPGGCIHRKSPAITGCQNDATRKCPVTALTPQTCVRKLPAASH